MTAGEDVSLCAPSLLHLSASTLADNAPGPFAESCSDTAPCLPIPASHALFEQYRAQWNKTGISAPRLLRPWVKADQLPLKNLNLSGASIDDHLLVELLDAHSGRIEQMDLSGVKGITATTNALLADRRVSFPLLKRLRLTGTELINTSTSRRKHGVAGLDQRNVPILGVEDLAGSNLDINRPSGSQPNPNNYDQPRASSSASAAGDAPEEPVEKWQEWEEEAPPVLTHRCPRVKQLYLPRIQTRRSAQEDEEQGTNELLSSALEPLHELTLLDLSYWTRVEDLRCLYPLHLHTLILYDVPDLYKAIDAIVSLSDLVCLDVSQSSRDTGTYPRPVTALHKMVTTLHHLTQLDISGTNLAAQPSAVDWPHKGNGSMRSDIFGLRFLARPLEYLGLFNCDNASHFAEIPAKQIAGDKNEDQVMTALQRYGERAGLLQAVLNESYQLYRFGNSQPLTRHAEALHLVLGAMRRHLEDSTLQIAGSASLFYIMRKVAMNRDTKKSVVSALLSGMETHMEEQVMVRNCCLSLCQFEIPQEILFDYSRLAALLVTVLQHHNSDNLTQRIVVFLLNSMACHVEGDQKVQVGNIGAIQVILEQIKRKLAANTCDDVMEVGWSFLWNITDETPVNCELFLNADGLRLFQQCYVSFGQERELVRNMMGLIGNIAEVRSLRHKLMHHDYIAIFVDLLSHTEDSIEISYNSAGVLAHIVSDGAAAWDSVEMCREKVMREIVQTTEKWKLDSRRFINYRSFRPILRLLPLFDAYASQHWAVWALANLTTTDGPKYCSFVVDEGGVCLLEELAGDGRATDECRRLASIVLDNIDKWRNQPTAEQSILMATSVESMDTTA